MKNTIMLLCIALPALCSGQSYRIRGDNYLILGNQWNYQLHYGKFENAIVNWWGTATIKINDLEKVQGYETYGVEETRTIPSVGTTWEKSWLYLGGACIEEVQWTDGYWKDTVADNDPQEVVPIGINSSDNNRHFGHGTYTGRSPDGSVTYTGYQNDYLTFLREEIIVVPAGVYYCTVFTTYNEWDEGGGWWGYERTTTWVTEQGIIMKQATTWAWNVDLQDSIETNYEMKLTSMNIAAITLDNDEVNGINPIDRLARWNRTTKTWEAVAPNSIGSGKVHVLTHGWGQGQREWVDQQTGLAKVWNSDTGYFNKLQTVVNAIDQVYDQSANVHIMCYSWIDQSATNSNVFWNNQSAESAKYRDLAANNLCVALMRAGINSAFIASHGELHFMGHSHGARVVTVAAHHLEDVGIDVKHLTLWDSPERSPVDEWYSGAYNYLDEYLDLMDIGTGQGQTFADNYWSSFGTPYRTSNVINVNMRTNGAFYHPYPVQWYAEATIDRSNGRQEGVMWSPLVADVYKSLYLEYERILFGSNIDHLDSTVQTVPSPYEYTNLTKSPISTNGTVQNIPNGIRLIENSPASKEWAFVCAPDDVAIKFDYQFLNPGNGDELAVWIDGKRRFIIPGIEVGSDQHSSVIDISDLDPNEDQHFITVRLHSTGASDADVQVTNFTLLSAPYPIADITRDYIVDFRDYDMLSKQWLRTPMTPSADIAPLPSKDGFVDISDLILLVDHWLETGALYVPASE